MAIDRQGQARRHDPYDAQVRRVRWQLALLVATLIAALVVALEAAVYVRAQDALMQPLRDAIAARAGGEINHLYLYANTHDLPEGRRPLTEENTGGIFITFAGPTLRVSGGSASPFGKALASPQSARAALAAGAARYSTRKYSGQTYLVYTLPVIRHGRLLGAIQTGVSEGQYAASLHQLLSILLLVGALGLLLAIGITAVVVQRSLRPIRSALQRQRDFISDAAHELRTPLAIIRTAAETGLTRGSQEEEAAALEQTLAQAGQLTRLTEDLLFLASSDSGALAVAHRPLDLSELVTATADAISVLAEDEDIRLEVDTSEDVWVQGDADRLRQLLVILLNNALKFTPPGGTVTVLVRGHGHLAELSVRDSGPGIAAADLPHLFDRFYRSDRARSGGGTGLGLAIAQSLAAAHGGEIHADNAPGGGAIFTVTLPLTRPRGQAESAPSKRRQPA